MNTSKRARRGIAIFARIQMRKYNVKYLAPSLTPQEKAIKMNERFDIEKEQRERRTKR